MNMHLSRVRLIAMREWTQKIHQRTFIITTVVQMIAVLALVLAPTVISAIFAADDGGGNEADTVRVIDTTGSGGTVTDALNAYAGGAGENAQIAFEPAPADAEAATLLENGDADGVLTVSRNDDGALAFSYANENGDVNQAALLTRAAVQRLAQADALRQAGVQGQQASRILAPVPMQMVSAEGETTTAENTEQGFRYGIAYFSAILLYMVMLIYGMWIAQGVVVEKSSRIMEIMINAASPTELMLGKIFGIGLAGLTQIVPMLLIAGVGLVSQQWLADALDVTGGIDVSGIDFGTLSLTLVVFFLIYFLLGFLLYAALYAGVGSLVSRQEDVQTIMTPMTLAVIIGFFGAIFTLSAPDSVVAQVVSIFPFTSPMAMVPRLLLGDPAVWEIALSIALLAVTGLLAVLLAARLYRMGVLMYGQKPSLKVVFMQNRIKAAR